MNSFNDYVESLISENIFNLNYGNGNDGKNRHKKFAESVGYAASSLSKKEMDKFVSSSYNTIYMKTCLFNPVISKKTWNKHLQIGYKIRKGIDRSNMV